MHVADRLTRRGMNLVPQVENVFPTLTVAENLHVGALVLPREERQAEIARVLELFPLLAERRGSARARSRAASASSWRSRAHSSAARGCCSSTSRRPDCRRSRSTSSSRSSSRSAGLGIAIVMVEQNARRALALADTGYVLDTGRNAYSGPGTQLLDDPRVVELYLGGSGLGGARG